MAVGIEEIEGGGAWRMEGKQNGGRARLTSRVAFEPFLIFREGHSLSHSLPATLIYMYIYVYIYIYTYIYIHIYIYT